MAYVNVRDRDLLGSIIGATILDVTQHDQDEWDEEGECYWELHFDNGVTVHVDVCECAGFHVLNVPDE